LRPYEIYLQRRVVRAYYRSHIRIYSQRFAGKRINRAWNWLLSNTRLLYVLAKLSEKNR